MISLCRSFESFAICAFPSFRLFKCHSTACWIFQLAVVATILALGVSKAWQAANRDSSRLDDTIPR
jgi:hypothetical protein